MKLPAANDYIATDFSLLADGGAPAAERAANGADDEITFPSPPALLLDVPGLRVWHKGVDNAFLLPRTNTYFKAVSPLVYADPRCAALTQLTTKVLEDALCETTYLADVAGLHYNIWFEGRQGERLGLERPRVGHCCAALRCADLVESSTMAGIDFKIDGFSHKLPVLTEFIFRTLAGLAPSGDAFARVKESVLRQVRRDRCTGRCLPHQVQARCLLLIRSGPPSLQYRNANMKPHKHASYLRLAALKDLFWSAEDILKVRAQQLRGTHRAWADVHHPQIYATRSPPALPACPQEMEQLSREDLAAFLPRLLADLHVEALLHGNIRAADAEQLARQVHSALGGSSLAAEARPVECSLELPAGGSLLHRVGVKNAEEDNSVAELYLQCGMDTASARAAVDMVDQLVHEPCYDALRTKEQLGYTVHSGMRLTHGVLGFCVVIVSGARGRHACCSSGPLFCYVRPPPACHGGPRETEAPLPPSGCAGVYPPSHLDARMEAFLEVFSEKLGGMSEAEFEEQRQALLAAKLMKDRSMVEESDRAWEAIAGRRYNFHARRDEVSQLRALTLPAVRDFYAAHIRGGARRKLSVHVAGKAHLGEVAEAAPEGVTTVADPFALKATLPKCPVLVGTPAAPC